MIPCQQILFEFSGKIDEALLLAELYTVFTRLNAGLRINAGSLQGVHLNSTLKYLLDVLEAGDITERFMSVKMNEEKPLLHE